MWQLGGRSELNGTKVGPLIKALLCGLLGAIRTRGQSARVFQGVFWRIGLRQALEGVVCVALLEISRDGPKLLDFLRQSVGRDLFSVATQLLGYNLPIGAPAKDLELQHREKTACFVAKLK